MPAPACTPLNGLQEELLSNVPPPARPHTCCTDIGAKKIGIIDLSQIKQKTRIGREHDGVLFASYSLFLRRKDQIMEVIGKVVKLRVPALLCNSL